MGRKLVLGLMIGITVLFTTGVMATPASEMTFFNVRAWYHRYTNVDDFADVTGNCLLNSGQLSASHASGKMSLISPVDYKINGVVYHKNATANFWDLTAERDLPAGHPCYMLVLFTINADGTSSYVTPATFASTPALALAQLGVKDGMGYPDDQAVVGYMIVGNQGHGHDWSAVDLADPGGAATFRTVYNGYPQSQRIVTQ